MTLSPKNTKAKKPYTKPAVVFRERLEAIAAVCTGTSSGPGKANAVVCPLGPISS